MPAPVPPPPRAPTGAPPAAPRPPAPAAPVAAAPQAPSAPPAPRPPVAPAPVSAPAAPVAQTPVAPQAPVAQTPVIAPVTETAAPVAPIVAPVSLAPVIAPVSLAPIAAPQTTAPAVARKAKETYGTKEIPVPTFGGQDVLALGAQLEEWLKAFLPLFKADGDVTTKGKFPDTAAGHKAYGLSRCFLLIAQTLTKGTNAPKGKDPVVEKMRNRTLAIIKSFGYARFMEEFAQDGADTIQMLNLTAVEKAALGIPA